MSDKTHIQWCDATFNPWIGCTKVSPGCANCYAEKERATSMLGVKWGKDKERHRTSAGNWKKPLLWNRVSNGADKKRPRVFCASLADWLDDEVPIEWLSDLLKLIHETPNLDWLLLTKRPENWKDRLRLARKVTERAYWTNDWFNGDTPSNIWFGVSVEDQARAEERIPQLLEIPARVRFLSVEPLLGPIVFDHCGGPGSCSTSDWTAKVLPSGIHWVIVGGESGPKARTCHIEWIASIVNQCRAAGVAPFVKQLGSDARRGALCHGPNHGAHPLNLRHPKGGDMSDWPEDLRVREFPQ